ncbi:hypothetical protein J6590_078352 [Homalodisca vitripennis]|nr:hypothetical protein J6590_078352 [Homalodisca vitripennis]
MTSEIVRAITTLTTWLMCLPYAEEGFGCECSVKCEFIAVLLERSCWNEECTQTIDIVAYKEIHEETVTGICFEDGSGCEIFPPFVFLMGAFWMVTDCQT